MIEGALDILYSLDLDKDKRIDLLTKTTGLTQAKAIAVMESREKEERANRSNKAEERMKDLDVEKQRKIGKQQMVVKIIKSENESVVSFVSKDEIAAWSDMTKAEIELIMDYCKRLDNRKLAVNAAREYEFGNSGDGEVNSYAYLLHLFSWFGRNILKESVRDIIMKNIGLIANANYDMFHDDWENIQICDEMRTAEFAKTAMEYYIRFTVKTIREAFSEGYDWDVIKEMLGTDIPIAGYKKMEKNYS